MRTDVLDSHRKDVSDMINTCLNISEENDMAYSQKKLEYNLKYAKEKKRRIPLDVKKSFYEAVLSRIPEVADIGINTFIKAAIIEKIQRDGLDLPIGEYKP